MQKILNTILHWTHFILCTKPTNTIYRDGGTQSDLRAIVPRDALKITLRLHVYGDKNWTNYGGIICQNNTLQLQTNGLSDTWAECVDTAQCWLRSNNNGGPLTWRLRKCFKRKVTGWEIAVRGIPWPFTQVKGQNLRALRYAYISELVDLSPAAHFCALKS